MRPLACVSASALVAGLVACGCSGHPAVPAPSPRARASRPRQSPAPSPLAVAPEALLSPPEDVYAEEEIAFDAAGVTVHGTLTRPSRTGIFPAVVFVAGSGPTDRDWQSPMLPGSNGSAKLLARSLAAAGYVSVRYDKRASGQTETPSHIAWADYLDEIDGALRLLRERPFVRGDALFVAGHSEGGAHALRFATSRNSAIAGVILLATAGRTFRDLVLAQLEPQLSASGLPQPAIQHELGALKNALDAIGRGDAVDPAQVTEIEGVRRLIDAMQSPLAIAFTRELVGFEPTAAIARVRVPVLIVQGGKDQQVSPTRDAPMLERAARAAHVDVRLAMAPDADHVLKHEDTPLARLTPLAALEYNDRDRHLDGVVVAALTGWLDEHTRATTP